MKEMQKYENEKIQKAKMQNCKCKCKNTQIQECKNTTIQKGNKDKET